MYRLKLFNNKTKLYNLWHKNSSNCVFSDHTARKLTSFLEEHQRALGNNSKLWSKCIMLNCLLTEIFCGPFCNWAFKVFSFFYSENDSVKHYNDRQCIILSRPYATMCCKKDSSFIQFTVIFYNLCVKGHSEAKQWCHTLFTVSLLQHILPPVL